MVRTHSYGGADVYKIEDRPRNRPMIHPHSELRFVSPEIGLGVFATQFIPKGTITWVFDPLDQIVTHAKSSRLPARLQRQLDIYSYQNGRGERILRNPDAVTSTSRRSIRRERD